jgi:hypothetical protein
MNDPLLPFLVCLSVEISRTERSLLSNAIRALPLAAVLTSFTICGVMLWFDNDFVLWAHVVLLAAAVAIISGPAKTAVRRAFRSFVVGLATSLILVAIALVTGWITDRPHFFDDGGPIAGLLIIEFYIGLPAAFLAALLSGLVIPALKTWEKLTARQAI